MLIRRNVYFSAVDQETGEERLFSVNEVLTEEEYLERMFSDESDNEKESRAVNKGSGEAYKWGGVPAMIGHRVGLKVQDKAKKKGKSDEEAQAKGKKVASHVGAVTGGATAAGLVYGMGKLHDMTREDIGQSAKEVIGKGLNKLNKKSADFGNKTLYKYTKNAKKALGKANTSKVGKVVAGSVIGATGLSQAALSRRSARKAVDKTNEERKK